MRTKESLRNEIRELHQAMTQNNFELRRMQRAGVQVAGVTELLLARVEIMKSIAHRQALLIELMDNEIKFLSNWGIKEAA